MLSVCPCQTHQDIALLRLELLMVTTPCTQWSSNAQPAYDQKTRILTNLKTLTGGHAG